VLLGLTSELEDGSGIEFVLGYKLLSAKYLSQAACRAAISDLALEEEP
jgi:hypothetical protein